MSIPAVKSGYLLRRSSVLKRWKKNYFVLFADGNLSYYEDESKTEKHGNLNLYFNGKDIKTALECSVEPPPGHNYGCLMSVVTKDKEDVVLCAQDGDDCLAWKMMIEQPIAARARGLQPGRPPQGAQQISHQLPQNQYPYGLPPGVYPQQAPPAGQYPLQQGPIYYYPNYGPVRVLYTTRGRPYYVHPQTRVVHVIRDDDPYYYRGNGMMWGVAAGAMLGAALWTPFFFC